MTINYNPNLPKNDSLPISEVYTRVAKNPDVRTGDVEKALRTGGVSPSLARATAQSLKEDVNSHKSSALFDACLEDYYGD